MSSYKSKEEEFTAYMLSNPETFKILYYCAVTAAKNTTDTLSSSDEMSHLTFLPLETKDITRAIKPFFCNYKNVSIEYDWQDLTIVGGSAITALEIVTQKDTDNYLDVQTTDIDIVWWPSSLKGDSLLPIIAQKAPIYPSISDDGKTILTENYDTFLFSNFSTDIRKKNKYGITSLSPAIIHLTRSFAKNLQQSLLKYVIADVTYVTTIYNLCRTFYNVDPKTFTVQFTVEASCDTNLSSTNSKNQTFQKVKAIKGSILSGSWNVVAYMEIPTIPLRIKVLDIAIHDECSSQKSDTLFFKTDDPIYSSHYTPNSLFVMNIPRSKFTMTLPTIQRLLEQQYLALQNRIQEYWIGKYKDVQKILTHHRRIQYIIDILTEALYSDHNTYSKFLIKQLKLETFSRDYYTNILQNILPKKDEWIASCPIHFPPLRPCLTSDTDPISVKLCALQTCKIPTTSDSRLFSLCEENKVLQKELCSVPKSSSRRTVKNTKKNSKSSANI